MMHGWNTFEELRVHMTDSDLLQEFARAMGDDELLDTCEYIARMHDINVTDDED